MFIKIRTKYNNKSWNNFQKNALTKILSLVSGSFVGGDFKLNIVHHLNRTNVLNVL